MGQLMMKGEALQEIMLHLRYFFNCHTLFLKSSQTLVLARSLTATKPGQAQASTQPFNEMHEP
ncbi:hypothetical protein [Escherichia coli]|uniref:hypothetical protein n=1 Tax=Escherichia coli TaxID=562 RepID=UPI003F49308C